jgi:hypothetical protein
VSSLERELTALGPSIDWPDAPDLAASVSARIAAPTPRRRAPRRRVAVALAVVLAALLAVLAVPPARTAVFDWLGIGGVSIVRVEDLPTVPSAPGIEILGDDVTLDVARSRAGFAFADPPDHEPAPDEIRVAPGSRVSYLWRNGSDVTLLVTQFPGSGSDPGLLKKLAGSGTKVLPFELDGDPAVWLEGGPHVVYVVQPDGNVRDDHGWLAGNTLIVDRDGVTLRVEAALDRTDAVELVRAMR